MVRGVIVYLVKIVVVYLIKDGLIYGTLNYLIKEIMTNLEIRKLILNSTMKEVSIFHKGNNCY